MITRQLLLTSSAFALMFASSAALAADDTGFTNPYANVKWGPELQVESDIGVGHNDRDIGIPQMMIPVWQDDKSMLFTDLRYRFDDEQSQEYNLGLGFRKEINSDWILGGYGFFDRLSSASGELYSQGTLGVEALSVTHDARINVYMPQSTVHGATGGGQVEIIGNQIGIAGGEERALPGEDFELGQKLPFSFADVRLYGGGYRYTADNFGMVAGPRGRLELTLNDQYIPAIPFGAEVSLGGEIEHDQTRGTQQFVVLKLRIPFGGEVHKSTDTLDQRMNTFIERDVDIVEKTGNGGNGGLQAVEVNGSTISNVVNITSTSNFNTTVNAAGANTLFLVNGSSGAVPTTAATTLKAGQVLLGGGSTITMTGASTGTAVNYTAPGTAPTVTGSVAGSVAMANNTTIDGVNFMGLADGINVNGVSNVMLSNFTSTNTGSGGHAANGITIQGASNVTLSNVTVTGGTWGQGLDITGAASQNIALANITIFGPEYNDIYVNSTTVSGLTVNNSSVSLGNYGIAFNSATVTGLSGTGNALAAISSNCSSTSSSITGSVNYGASSHCP